MAFLKRKKNPFEASLILDKEGVKIVEAQYKDKPIFFGCGTAKKQAKEIKGEGGLAPPLVKGGYQYGGEYDWALFFNPNNMPGFLPMDDFRALATTSTTLASGVECAFATPIEPLPKTGLEPIKGIIISDKGIEIKKKRRSDLEI